MGLFSKLFGLKGNDKQQEVSASAGTAKADSRKASPKGRVTVNRVYVGADNIDDLHRRFIAIDTETTGLSPVTDRIVEVGAVIFEDGLPTRSYSTLVNPGIPIPAAATRVNHITNAMLRSAPKEREAYDGLMSFLGEAVTGDIALVAHNAQFDMSFISETFKRLGINARLTYIDTLALARHHVRGVRDYKQTTLAPHFGIRNDQEHRAEGDATTCGYIFLELLGMSDKEVERELELAKRSRPSEEEYQVCAFIQRCITEGGGDTRWLGFYRNTSNYVDVMYVSTFVKFKFARKGKYVIVDKADVPQGMTVEPCTMTEGGTDVVRVFFENALDLKPLAAYFRKKHHAAQRDAETHYFPYYKGYARELSATPAIKNALGKMDVERYLRAAEKANKEQADKPPAQASAAMSAVPKRDEVEISPVSTRVPLSKTKNRNNWDRGFRAGFPYWEKGEALRKAGDFEAAIEMYDRARYEGYVAPALYESYAMAYRKLGDYENEIAVLDEAIERIAPNGKLAARRDKAIELLLKRRESDRKAEERAARRKAEEERRTQAAEEKRRKAAEQRVAEATKLKDIKGLGEAIEAAGPIVEGGRAVVQMDDDLNVIAVYMSVNQASRIVGVNTKSIREAANGRQRHAGGYVWRYEDELGVQE